MTNPDEATVRDALMMGVRWGIIRNLPHFTEKQTEALAALQRLVNSNGSAPAPFLVLAAGESVPGSECPT